MARKFRPRILGLEFQAGKFRKEFIVLICSFAEKQALLLDEILENCI